MARLSTQRRVQQTHISSHATRTGKVEIADIGTGTGAWLPELATEFKDKRFKFTGLDISAAQFPADPPNGMAFAMHNILSPVPSHLLARFDIIHVRFLVLGLSSGSWPQAIENLHAMLRPSGWLQWSEPDFRNIITLPLSSPISPATSSLLQTGRSTILSLVAHGTQRHNLAFHDSETISSHFATAGFTNVTEIAFASDRVPETRLAISRVFAKGIAGLQKMICAGNGEEAGGQWGDEGEGRKVLNCVGEACERGVAYWRLELNVIIGRKSGI
ncbi:hypothetical protein B0A48_08188 [Cryoendolithus antarcticus]|uniref:Methyltransferase domain-containing protein n=1 Tax=Cryoendolithus antarcticus TaxID=1507870 RepID=A0A1V8T1S7_9PEZI|nr:hypothetical protein B0A48_08188 [Cryoendolithus antarcticus]